MMLMIFIYGLEMNVLDWKIIDNCGWISMCIKCLKKYFKIDKRKYIWEFWIKYMLRILIKIDWGLLYINKYGWEFCFYRVYCWFIIWIFYIIFFDLGFWFCYLI